MASIVSEGELRHVLRAWGPGDRVVGWVASRQLDVISAAQLRLAGVSRTAIATRSSRGFMQRLYQGVYLLGHSVPPAGSLELAAVLACGPGAVVSHRSAAALWGLMAPPDGEVTVTVVGGHRRSRDGLRVCRASALAPEDRRLRRGIPVTAPARALIDLSSETDEAEFERAAAEARVRGLLRDGELDAALARAGARAGVGRVRALLEAEGEPGYSRSEAERLMLKLIREARLPAPRVNTKVEGFEADFLWPAQKLIVEVDGYRFHSHRQAFERDRRRDAAHTLAGYRVIRVTWRQLTEERLAVAAMIAAALGQR